MQDDLTHGEVYTNSERSGAALWLPPGSPSPDLAKQLSLGLALLRTVGRRTLVAASALTKFEATRPPKPHWHLTILGTDPATQGQGVGSALLAPILDRCDRTGARAYLESSNPENVSYYQRFGLEVTGEINYRGGPTVPLMLRQPS